MRADLDISLHGFANTTDGTRSDPIGTAWWRLVAPYLATRTVQARGMGATAGRSTTAAGERRAIHLTFER